MKRAIVVDGPDCTTFSDVLGFLRLLGVLDPEALRINVFEDATRLGARIRIVDDAGQRPWLSEIQDGQAIPVIRHDQLAARIQRTTCPT